MKAFLSTIALLGCLAAVGCTRKPAIDHPRIPDGVRMQDVTFHSDALQRDMVYRVILPANPPAGKSLPVLWLLHGADADFTSWSNDSDIASFASRNVILVMPDAGPRTYYINSASNPHQRYEDYLVNEVIPNVRQHFPAASTDRAQNAILGVSRGGFAAVLLALKHPGLFSFVAGFSSAFDLAERPVHLRSPLESIGLRRAFGPRSSDIRRSNDPFFLIKNPHVHDSLPTFYFTCGERDVLLKSNQDFLAALTAEKIPFEWHQVPGDHGWDGWNARLPAFEETLAAHFHLDPAR